jgi:transposase-like protein
MMRFLDKEHAGGCIHENVEAVGDIKAMKEIKCKDCGKTFTNQSLTAHIKKTKRQYIIVGLHLQLANKGAK